VRNFLASNALFWLESITWMRCASTRSASMLYSTTRASTGEWIPNKFGGARILEAVEFLKKPELSGYRDHADTQTDRRKIPPAWPMCLAPRYLRRARLRLQVEHGLVCTTTLEVLSSRTRSMQVHLQRS
jgi:1,4-alpha-glucan branching enzyme